MTEIVNNFSIFINHYMRVIITINRIVKKNIFFFLILFVSPRFKKNNLRNNDNRLKIIKMTMNFI